MDGIRVRVGVELAAEMSNGRVKSSLTWVDEGLFGIFSRIGYVRAIIRYKCWLWIDGHS